MSVLDVDLTDHELYRHGFPHDVFTELRERGAVLQHPRTPLERTPDGVEFWVVTRYAEVQEASRDAQRFSSLDGPTLSPALDVQKGQAVVSADAPMHTRLRKLIAAGFTPRMIARLDEQVQRRTREILDAVDAHDGRVDFVRDVAYQLPMQLIGDIVGIPEADRPFVFSLTDTFMRAGDPRSGITDADREDKMLEMYRYATALCDDTRGPPAINVGRSVVE